MWSIPASTSQGPWETAVVVRPASVWWIPESIRPGPREIAAVLLYVPVTPPTVSPEEAMAARACASGMPVTSGTFTGCGPLETTSDTDEPAATLAPAAGVWVMT